MDAETRIEVAGELEAVGSALCDCDAADNPPVSPATCARMAHHCECRAVIASEIIRRGQTRTLHAQACSPDRQHPGEEWKP